MSIGRLSPVEDVHTFHPPPWPKIPSFARLPLTPFDEYKGPGLRSHTSESSKSHHHPGSRGRNEEGPPSYTVNKAGLTVVRLVDAWTIGDERVEWIEPPGTTSIEYELDTQPFQRLMGAVDGFYQSRQPAFAFKRFRLMFDIIRNHLGLRSDSHGQHGVSVPQTPLTESRGLQSCVLLRRPVTAVRGFLAMARCEAESGWDAEPAILLADILSAFLCYVRHHGALRDIPAFEAAVEVARGARRRMQQAKALEDMICDVRGWNRVAWNIWGGVYGSPERGGSKGTRPGVNVVSVTPTDDGGWGVGHYEGIGHDVISSDEAQSIIGSLIFPESMDDYAMDAYIPFARRRVTRASIGPPQSVLGSRKHWQLVTVPAPWTQEEKWRDLRPWATTEPLQTRPLGDVEITKAFDVESSSFKKDPEEMNIFVEPFDIPPDALVGIAFRGRWGRIKHKTGSQEFWIHEAKDYILPSFWSMGEASK